MKELREKGTPLVIDADGLYIVTKNLDLVKGYPHAILTPNKNEYQRLANQLGIDIEQVTALECTASGLHWCALTSWACKTSPSLVCTARSAREKITFFCPPFCRGAALLKTVCLSAPLSGSCQIYLLFSWEKHQLAHAMAMCME